MTDKTTAVTAEQMVAVEVVRTLLDAVPRSCIKDTPMVPVHVLTLDTVLASHDTLLVEVERLRAALSSYRNAVETLLTLPEDGMRDIAITKLADAHIAARAALPEEATDGD